MPREKYPPDHRFADRRDLLSFEEILTVVRSLLSLGVDRVRLTGGEPLLRRRVNVLVAGLNNIEGVRDIAMTTNGSLLGAQAASLAAAGLHRVTVSLDALDEPTFRRITDVVVTIDRILDGIERAIAVGLTPVKVNTVVRRGWNDDQIEAIAVRFRGTGIIPRFIEYMDVGTTNGWRREDVVGADEIRKRIDGRWGLEPIARVDGAVAERWRYVDGAGEVGIIASVTRPFCGDCSRLRLSADGRLFLCLFGRRGFDLRGLLRSGASSADVAGAVQAAWRDREDRYSEMRETVAIPWPRMEMNYVGG